MNCRRATCSRPSATAVHAKAQLTWVPTDFLTEQKVEAWSDMPVWVPAQGDSAGFAKRNIKKALTGRADVPAVGDDIGGHAGVVSRATRRSPGEAESRPYRGARECGADGMA